MSGRSVCKTKIIRIIIYLPKKEEEFLYSVKLDTKNTLGKELKDFLRLKNCSINIPLNIYLITEFNEIVELDKNKSFSDIQIKTNDKIIITDKKLKVNEIDVNIETSSNAKRKMVTSSDNIFGFIPIIYTNKSKILIKNKDKFNIKNRCGCTKKKILIISIFSSLIVFLTVFLCLKLIPPSIPSSPSLPIYRHEDNLIVNISYLKDILFLYENNRIYKMISYQKGKEKNTETEQLLNADIFFIIRNKITKFNITTKNYYSGYLGILSMEFKNKTDQIHVIYDKRIDKIFNIKKNIGKKEPNLTYIGENGNLCLAKIEFSENGEITNISFPSQNITFAYMQYIKDYAKLIIPKISADLYTNNINQSLNELLLNDKKNKLRQLKQNKNKNRIIKKKIRRISSNESSDDFYYEIEEYITPSDSEPINHELREKINNSNYNENVLYEVSVRNIQNDEINLENSFINKTIKRSINNLNNVLESIVEFEKIFLKTPDDDNDVNQDTSDILDSDFYLDNSDVNNDLSDLENNNGFSESDFFENEEEEDNDDFNDVNIDYDFGFEIENLIFDSINKIFLKENLSNDEVIKNLYRYFDEFQYELFNESSYLDILTSQVIKTLKEDDNITDENINITYREENISENDYKNSLRRISENSYYGMKKMLKKKDLYNYNMLGLKMQNQLFNELDPSTGISYSYFIMTFGNKNIKMKTSEIYSNMNVILEKKNNMIFNLIKLVNKTNYNLKSKNKNFTNIILDLENNLIELFNDVDYTNLFRDHLNYILGQLNNLNGNIFDELFRLINEVYDNYSLILEDVKNKKYDTFRIIRDITKKEYMTYISNMIQYLDIFYNNTINFLNEIEIEVNNLLKIEKSDFLFDILDNIYQCKLILKEFNKYLFKSIEKGITLFEIDLYDFIENVIGDLLYITDYLYININKNEILIKTYTKEERELLAFKLKKIKEIVNIIFELLSSDIMNDYQFEISSENNTSIKYITEKKTKKYLSEIEMRSNEIVKNIKTKIKYMNLYELYSDNLDYINYVHNKSLIDFMSDSYNNVLKNIFKFKPDYLDENSDLIVEKNELFKTSKLIVENINNEINEISNYIKDYVLEYKEEKIYNIHFNIYKINGLFYENETKFLFDGLREIMKNTIEKHVKTMNYNYKLGFNYLKDLKHTLLDVHDDDDTYICKGFIKRYNKFIEYFNDYVLLVVSDNSLILKNMENNYNRIKNEIFNYLKNNILSINDYGFENNIYKDNFYFIKQMNEKLISIFGEINEYFTEERYNFFQNEIIQLFMTKIYNYNEKKTKEYTDLYKYILNRVDGVSGSNNDYVYEFKRLGKWHTRYCTLDTKDNINRVDMSITNKIDYVNKNVDNLIKNFKNRVDKFLSNYIFNIQNLYTNMNLFLQNKINNNENIAFLLEKYKNIFHNLLEKN